MPVIAEMGGGLVGWRILGGREGTERSILGTGTPIPRVELMVVGVVVVVVVDRWWSGVLLLERREVRCLC